MNNRRRLFPIKLWPLLLLTVLTPGILPAQTATEGPPTIRLASAPENCSWTIKYIYAKAEEFPAPQTELQALAYAKIKEANPRLKETRVVKRGKQRLETHVYENGQEDVNWIDGDLMLTQSRRFPKPFIHSLADADGIKFDQDFHALAWVNRAAYGGLQNVAGKRCHTYAGANVAEQPTQTAAIHEKSGLPAQVMDETVIQEFSFQAGAPPITIPAEIAKALAEHRQRQSADARQDP